MTELIICIVSLLGTLSGSYFASRKNTVLVVYRLEQLENKVNKHNNIIERTFELEKKCTLYEERFNVANHRIEDLEKEK